MNKREGSGSACPEAGDDSMEFTAFAENMTGSGRVKYKTKLLKVHKENLTSTLIISTTYYHCYTPEHYTKQLSMQLPRELTR